MTNRMQIYLAGISTNRNIQLYSLGDNNMEATGRANKLSLKPNSYQKVVQRHRNNKQVLQIMQFIRDQEELPKQASSQRQSDMPILRKPTLLPSIRSKHRDIQQPQQPQEHRFDVRTPESEESGYNADSDSDYELEMYNRTIPSPPRTHSPVDIFDHSTAAASTSNSLVSRSHHSYCPGLSRDIHARTRQNHACSNLASSMHQLPPIERVGIPSRPSAPAPSFTPPLPDALDDYVAEEPIDYIDQE